MATTEMSAEDKEFLAACEEQFKDRFTDKDEGFMKVFNAEPSKPPIMESWWVPQNAGRRNDRHYKRRSHPYERNNRDNDRRGYRDNRDDGNQGGYRNQRPRHY